MVVSSIQSIQFPSYKIGQIIIGINHLLVIYEYFVFIYRPLLAGCTDVYRLTGIGSPVQAILFQLSCPGYPSCPMAVVLSLSSFLAVF